MYVYARTQAASEILISLSYYVVGAELCLWGCMVEFFNWHVQLVIADSKRLSAINTSNNTYGLLQDV